MRRGPAAAARIAIGSLLLVGALMAGGGCAAPHPPAARPGPAPTPAELLGAMAQRQAVLRVVNMRARATSWIGGDRLRATVLMLVDRGGRLRFEAEISLQGTVATLATDRDRFQLLDARKGELRQGPACPANVASLIRIPLAPADVAAILLGDVTLPASVAPEMVSVAWDAASGSDVLAIKDGGRETRVLFKGRDVVGASASSGGRTLWRVSYEELEGGAGLRLPSLIRFAEKDGSFDDGVEIKVKDRTVNPALRAEDFTIGPPAGVRVIEVGCGPGP